MNKILKFSIFTPVFNRAKYMPIIFESLLSQEEKSFEWVVVDDGSSDNIDSVMQAIMNDVRRFFPIKYVKQSNKGKHVAQNRAIDLSDGIFFAPLDSDDTITPDALKILWDAWLSLDEVDRKSFSGIGVLCKNSNGEIVGSKFPRDYFVSNDLEIAFKYKVKGEKWGVVLTSIIKQYKNTEVKGHFLSESTVWFRIARDYPKRLYLNAPLRVYDVHDDSVTTHLSHSRNYNFESRLCSDLIYINEFYDWYLKYRFVSAVKLPVALTYFCIANSYPVIIGKKSLLRQMKPMLCKLLSLLSLPIFSFLTLARRLFA